MVLLISFVSDVIKNDWLFTLLRFTPNVIFSGAKFLRRSLLYLSAMLMDI